MKPYWHQSLLHSFVFYTLQNNGVWIQNRAAFLNTVRGFAAFGSVVLFGSCINHQLYILWCFWRPPFLLSANDLLLMREEKSKAIVFDDLGNEKQWWLGTHLVGSSVEWWQRLIVLDNFGFSDKSIFSETWNRKEITDFLNSLIFKNFWKGKKIKPQKWLIFFDGGGMLRIFYPWFVLHALLLSSFLFSTEATKILESLDVSKWRKLCLSLLWWWLWHTASQLKQLQLQVIFPYQLIFGIGVRLHSRPFWSWQSKV